MLAASQPVLIPVPFASGAGAGYITPIPIPSQISGGNDPGIASMTDGFTPITFESVSVGGLPPRGQDFNGILNLHSTAIRWDQAGCGYPYNAAFSTSIGGYPQGAVIPRSDLSGGWISTVDANTSNPDTGGAGWLPYGGSSSILSVTLTSSSVTPTALQAASPIIVLSGALTASVSLILPSWVGVRWLIINNCTGAFAVTVKTATGTGVVVSGASNVYCNSAGIQVVTVSAGTVTSVAVVNANGVSGSISNPTTTPAITLALGAITPTSVTASGAVQAASFNRTSDKRLKSRIKRLRVARDAAESIRLYQWKWNRKAGKELASKESSGVLADEVEKVFPACVTVNEEGFKTVDYGLLAVHLILSGR